MEITQLQNPKAVELWRQTRKAKFEIPEPNIESVIQTPLIEPKEPQPDAEKSDKLLEQRPMALLVESGGCAFSLVRLHATSLLAPRLSARVDLQDIWILNRILIGHGSGLP